MMDNGWLKKLERILLVVFMLLGIVVVIGGVLLIRLDNIKKQEEKTKDEEIVEEETYDWEAGLSDHTLWLPENCKIYSKVPEFRFTDEQGVSRSITQFEGKPVVVVFWASWCSDCKEQMPFMKDYMQLSKNYEDVTFLFINKTDGERETKESAISYFNELGANGELFFDEDLTAYEQLGIHNIPTTLFLDANGIISAWSPKQITKESEFDALLNKALNGGSDATKTFIIKNLMDEFGGIHSVYDLERGKTFSSDILSESQGAMLEYAVLSKNQELFDRILDFIRTNLWEEGLTSWQIKENKTSTVNALIDDFRIYQALEEASGIWSGYEDILNHFREKLLKYGLKNGRFVDFYNAKSKEYANRFTLCYADFKAMEQLSKSKEEVISAYESSKEIVLNGQISDTFPLFYSWYNYKERKYEKDDLNSAEAMVTLLHLAEVDLLPNNTLKWLKTQMKQSGVKARYTIEGKVVEGYNYDSTAVYALVAMIGVEVGDFDLVNQAIKKMEKMRIDDTNYSYNGAFGMEDGSGITSFDQVMPLLAYMKIYGK
ncbi:redoxin domain-containing protein [Candidatus Galacturonibacter soehngenii]|uniref:Redoxin domain-containing protein n=2 Tax=Candidatus Galacturonatibacter soehngenii TaxID=2307010 RepID=A0A7V7QM65_9FIRM|nr:redoxin domain-containing protein [Candidatus Galacturonibacter soehngenii]